MRNTKLMYLVEMVEHHDPSLCCFVGCPSCYTIAKLRKELLPNVHMPQFSNKELCILRKNIFFLINKGNDLIEITDALNNMSVIPWLDFKTEHVSKLLSRFGFKRLLEISKLKEVS